jgi:hypothetical protein
VPCPFTGEVLFLFLLLLLTMMMMMTKGFLGAGTYFRIAEFIGFKLNFVITDAT